MTAFLAWSAAIVVAWALLVRLAHRRAEQRWIKEYPYNWSQDERAGLIDHRITLQGGNNQ